jgi:hypothetical protein
VWFIAKLCDEEFFKTLLILASPNVEGLYETILDYKQANGDGNTTM